MPRVIKEHAERRNEIIAVTQRLVYTKGFDQMTIQDILDETQISKGAFYHYFDSKQQLLEALIEHMQLEAEQFIIPIVQDTQLPALEKLQRLMDAAAQWKTTRKDYILALMRVWYADQNAIVRQKVQAALVKQTAPFFTAIVQQGVREGVFSTSFPEHIGEIILTVLQGMGETFVDFLILRDPESEDIPELTKKVAAYTDALERILGAPTGSIKLMDHETIVAWGGVQKEAA